MWRRRRRDKGKRPEISDRWPVLTYRVRWQKAPVSEGALQSQQQNLNSEILVGVWVEDFSCYWMLDW
jgi:hypothetical protein